MSDSWSSMKDLEDIEVFFGFPEDDRAEYYKDLSYMDAMLNEVYL